MPVDQNGQWYNAPVEEVAFDLDPPIYVTVSGSTAAFDVGGYDSADCVLGVHEFYVTACTGSNNDLVWVAKSPGASSLTIAYIDPSTASASLYASMSGSDVSVYLATGTDSRITTTAHDLIEYVRDDGPSAIENAVLPIVAPGNTGTGSVAAFSVQSLGGPTGNSPTLDVSLEETDDGTNFYEAAAFGQKTAAGVDRQVFGPFADEARWTYVVGGTGSVGFVFSVGARAKRDG